MYKIKNFVFKKIPLTASLVFTILMAVVTILLSNLINSYKTRSITPFSPESTPLAESLCIYNFNIPTPTLTPSPSPTSIPPTPTPGSGTTYQVTDGGSDYNINCDGTPNLSNTTLTIGARPECATQPRHFVDLIFKNVQIPKYATVTDARLEVVSSVAQSSNFTVTQTIYAGLQQNYGTTDWVINSPWSSNQVVQSTNFAGIFTQTVADTNWTSGRDVTIRLVYKDGSGSGTRTIKSFESGSANAPKLIISYNPPTVTLTPTPTPYPACSGVTVTGTTIDNTAQSWSGTSCIPQNNVGYLRFGITNNTGQSLAVTNIRTVWNDDKGHQCGADKSLQLVSGTLANQSFYQGPPNLTRTTTYGVSQNTNVSLPTGASTLNYVTDKFYNNLDGTECFSLYVPSRSCWVYGGYGTSCNKGW